MLKSGNQISDNGNLLHWDDARVFLAIARTGTLRERQSCSVLALPPHPADWKGWKCLAGTAIYSLTTWLSFN